MVGVNTELSLINKHVRFHNSIAGETIIWYELLAFGTIGGSTYDDVYDEGDFGTNGRKYATGVPVPVIYVEEIEDEARAIEDGRQPTQKLSLTILFQDMEDAGIKFPEEYRPHLNDMFRYDGRYYNVYRYKARGRLRNEVIIAVEGVETFLEQEQVMDTPPTYAPSSSLPWPATFPS